MFNPLLSICNLDVFELNLITTPSDRIKVSLVPANLNGSVCLFYRRGVTSPQTAACWSKLLRA